MTIAALNRSVGIPLKYSNRHGLITGQTGTGKTISLMTLAESFSAQGVPVFVSDVKGDIAALTRSCPSTVLDVFGTTGKPLRTTISAMGADLLARALELTDTQAGCLEIAFAVARSHGFTMQTIDDLKRVLLSLGTEIDVRAYGQVSKASVSVIMRALLRLEEQGAAQFFKGPQFDVAALLETVDLDLAQYATHGPNLLNNGMVSILDSVRLINSPRVYGAFLLWLLSELWDRLPEVGDMDKPCLVMFFDEAHLLFQDCPAALLRRIEQTVRLIRSKGVGVYFVSQSPNDIPPMIREQLAHRIEHDRALPVGAARFTTMTAQGRPAPTQTVKIDLPSCDLGPLSALEQVRIAPMIETPMETPGMSPGALAWAIGAIMAAVAFLLWQFANMTWIPVGIGLIAAALTSKTG